MADNDFLALWVERLASSSDPGDGEYAQLIAGWLPRATSDDWHRAALDYNWDFGDEPLLWIIRQERCEKATALKIFYLARPGQMVDYGNDRDKVPGWQRDAFDLVSEIRKRYMNGFYRMETVAFDATEALEREAYLPATFDQDALDVVIPPEMRISIQGRNLGQQYDVPNDFL